MPLFAVHITGKASANKHVVNLVESYETRENRLSVNYCGSCEMRTSPKLNHILSGHESDGQYGDQNIFFHISPVVSFFPSMPEAM